MTPEQREAVEWLEGRTNHHWVGSSVEYGKILLAMLAGSTTPDIKERLDRIEARQLLLYEKLAGIRSPLTEPARHDLVTEWNAVAKP